MPSAAAAELAMICDLIIAATRPARIQLRWCTQRLTRAIGRAKAMDLILTGGRHVRTERSGLSRGWCRVCVDDRGAGCRQPVAFPPRRSRPREIFEASRKAPVRAVVLQSMFATADQKGATAAFVSAFPTYE